MRHDDALKLHRAKLRRTMGETAMQHGKNSTVYIISHDSKGSCEYIVWRGTFHNDIGTPDAVPLARCASLEEARASLPSGLQLRETYDAHDDSVITETWY